MTLIRTMTRADVPLGMRLKQQAGWNQTEADWHRFLSLAPQSCFVAEDEGRGVGTAAAFVFGPVAWIAMVLVDESMRGRGLGTALMRHALAWLDERGIASVRLDATPLGRPLYEKLGFVAQFELARFAGVVSLPPGSVEPQRRAGAGELEEAIALDWRVTNTERASLLRAMLEHGATMVVRGQPVSAYAVVRAGAQATHIGPVLGDAEGGAALLQACLAEQVGRRVYVDVPLDHTAAVSLVRQAGLSEQRQLTRMCRGAAVLETVSSLWASSGPEKG